jgi:rRNA maturation protein Nop10
MNIKQGLGEGMARQILQQCLTCQAWTLSTTCTSCDGTAQAAAPLKWSPEDNRATIRRKMYDVESPEWTQSLPTLPSLQEMKDAHVDSEEE